jgi:hypothetical protein
VTREGGVSWSESVAIDMLETDEARMRSRESDTEQNWEPLVDDPQWLHDASLGGFNFLDPIGYRYYLAPAMLRCCRGDGEGLLASVLTIDGEYREEQISLLGRVQKAVIARFVRFMIGVYSARNDLVFDEDWKHAYVIYWKQWDRGSV